MMQIRAGARNEEAKRGARRSWYATQRRPRAAAHGRRAREQQLRWFVLQSMCLHVRARGARQSSSSTVRTSREWRLCVLAG